MMAFSASTDIKNGENIKLENLPDRALPPHISNIKKFIPFTNY